MVGLLDRFPTTTEKWVFEGALASLSVLKAGLLNQLELRSDLIGQDDCRADRRFLRLDKKR